MPLSPLPLLRPVIAALVLLLPLGVLPGCQTPQSGVKSAFGSQFAIVSATVEETTEAAVAVLEALGVEEVTATSTEIDGEITGFTADRTRVEVYTVREDEGKTELSVTVGAVGDAATGAEIIARIRQRLGS